MQRMKVLVGCLLDNSTVFPHKVMMLGIYHESLIPCVSIES